MESLMPVTHNDDITNNWSCNIMSVIHNDDITDGRALHAMLF